jgi:hypothetical protein
LIFHSAVDVLRDKHQLVLLNAEVTGLADLRELQNYSARSRETWLHPIDHQPPAIASTAHTQRDV